jgi:5-methylcytosine-specific restriction endonuclease McrA
MHTMTLIGPPWELSQITERARAKRQRRRTRRPLTHGQLTEYLDTPCPYCGVLMTDWNGREDWRAPSRDHRIPRSRGGGNSVANVEIICRRCNSNKGSMTPEEFVRHLARQKTKQMRQRR